MPLRSLREPDSAQPIRKWLLCQALFGVPFETSKTFRSAVLAVSSSRIKKLSEYMILKASPIAIAASLLKRFKSYSTAKEIRIKTRTQRRLVPIVVFEIRGLLVSGNRTYQPGVNSGPR